MKDYPSTPWIITGLLGGYVFVWFMQLGIRWPAFGEIRIEFLMGLVLTVLAVLQKAMNREKAEPSSGLGLPVALLLIAISLQVPWSQDYVRSKLIFQDRVLKFSLLALFLSTFINNPKDCRYFLIALLGSWFYITMESFRSALTGSMMWENQGIPRLHGDTPLFHHPNSLAGLAVGIFPFVIFLFPAVSSKAGRILLAALAVTAGGSLLYSGSRTGYLAVLVFFLFLFLRSSKKWKFGTLAAILLFATYPFIPLAYKERFESIFTQEDKEGASIQRRMEIQQDALKIFERHPFGVGVSAFPAVRERLFGRTQDTHNLYLEVATNLGIQGLLIFIYFIFACFRSLSRTLRLLNQQITALVSCPNVPACQSHRKELIFLQAMAQAAVGYLIIRLALGLFGMDLYEIYWWLVVGLAAALWQIAHRAQKITERYLHAPATTA